MCYRMVAGQDRNGGVMKRILALFAAAACGCIYGNVSVPLAYRAPTAQEAHAEKAADTEGLACNQAVVFGLFAWGDGGYAAAVADARAKSGAVQLADVRADVTLFNVLGLYSKACTRVTGKVG